MKLIELKGEKGYSKLSHLPFNRDFKLRPQLVESIKTHGFIQPIILCYTKSLGVCKELVILDGQNRALAAQYLNTTFYAYVLNYEPTSKEQLVKLVAKLNNSSVAWKLEDYAKAWHSLNNENYTTLLQLYKKYGYTLGIIAVMLAGYNSKGYSVGESIKQGKFVVRRAEETVSTLKAAVRTKRMSSRMLIAFHRLRLTFHDFDMEHFIKEFNSRYEDLKASRYDEYYDVFVKLIK